MSNVISLFEKKNDVSNHERHLLKVIRDLDSSIKTAEAAFRMTELKALRTSLNQMKNAKYVLEKQLKVLGA